jgi:hypothetical protein
MPKLTSDELLTHTAMLELFWQVLGTVENVKLVRGSMKVFVRYDDGDDGWADYPDEGFEIVGSEAVSSGGECFTGFVFLLMWLQSCAE